MKYSSILDKKISSQIQTQFPEFVQSEHPAFILFLKYYYQFLESAELSLLGSNDYVIEETQSVNYILDSNGEKIVLESSAGKFTVGEVIVGQVSKATATVLVDDYDDENRLFITSQQLFQPGELVVGQDSGASAIIDSYRANPVQNIQQFLEYADVDYTLYEFLDKFRDTFMESIPASLASDVSKRNLLKNIKELYTSKGTEDGHKLFFRLLLDEEPEIIYPRDNILRASDGVWSTDKVMRIVENGTSDFTNVIGKRIYTKNELDQVKASVIVANVVKFREGAIAIAQLYLDENSIIGFFESGETVYGVDSILDLEISGEIESVVTAIDVVNSGFYYAVEDNVSVQSLGSDTVTAKIGTIGIGKIDEVMIDNPGSGYAIGDQLVFNNANTEGVGAFAKVVVVGGSFVLESSTSPAHLISESNDFIISEDEFYFQLEQSVDETDSLLLENGDNIIIEEETFNNLGVSEEIGEITKIKVINSGDGYTSLPTATISSSSGSGAEVFPISTKSPGVGHVRDIEITNFGLNYSTTPDITLNRNVVIKNVSGIISSGDSLSSHDGTVIGYDQTRRILKLNTSATFYPGDIIRTGTGSSAVVHFSSPAAAVASIGTIGTTIGNFLNSRGKVSETTMRIQDSFYYQDYSYIVRVGQSINEWRESVKQSIHPSGWNLFGEVSFSTFLRAKVDLPNYSRGSQEYDLPTLYMEPLFTSIFGRRIGTIDDTVQSSEPNKGFDYLSELENGERDVTLKHEIMVSLSVSRGSHFKGSVLANLPKYAFAIPEITEAAVIPNYPNPAGRRVTNFNDITRGLYSIEQFSKYTIKQVSDYCYIILSSGIDEGYKIQLENEEGYILEEQLSIPSAAYVTRINVPPPSQITWN
jgi:hypothetical protein